MMAFPLYKRILSWLLTPIFLISFVLILVTFELLLRIAWCFGYGAHIRVYNVMNFFLLHNFRVMGTRISISHKPPLSCERPVILVSNHQSMYDIPLLIWAFRRHHPKFISKIELSKGLPGISFPLRTLGSVLIDRKNPAQAIPAIVEFAKRIARNNWTACIFPEGTRARTGQMKPFKFAGFKALHEHMPNAQIVPVAIKGSWELVRYKLLPVPFGVHLELIIHPAFDASSASAEELCDRCEKIIRNTMGQTDKSDNALNEAISA